MICAEKITDTGVKSELARIAEQSNGILLPEKVVESARSKKSLLHEYFEWDDSKAGELYRIDQARKLIRVVVVEDTGTKTHEPVWVHVSTQAGYMSREYVLSTTDLREQYLSDARRDAAVFTAKYSRIKDSIPFYSDAKRFSIKKE